MELNYKKFGEGFPVIILHGLFGSLDSWQTIAKKLAEAPFAVYIADQRNHGRSPHSDDFNYQLLADDLRDFYKQHGIEKAHLIGHSMGGKTVMLFALQNPALVEKLIVVDVAPVAYGDRHSQVFNALFAADVKSATDRKEVESVLRRKLENDESTVQFLLKGLSRDAAGKHFEWKFNLESLHKHYDAVSAEVTEGRPFEGEALFIKGGNSNYINSTNYSVIHDLFPDNQLTEIKDAGHWVQAEKPQKFTDEVLKFLK